MEPLGDRLALVGRHIQRARAAIESDRGSSPVLKAVVLEFERKFEKMSQAQPTRESIVELEQAADSANVAAKADAGAADETRKLVDLAHTAICLIKHEGQV
jgi:hypothetical protein